MTEEVVYTVVLFSKPIGPFKGKWKVRATAKDGSSWFCRKQRYLGMESYYWDSERAAKQWASRRNARNVSMRKRDGSTQ